MTIALVVLGVAAVMFVVERWFGARRFPRVRGWWWRAAALNSVQLGAVFLAGWSWDGWLLEQRLWSAAPLGEVGGAVVGYLVVVFVYYWWHRLRHEVPFLWRWFHQIHHSAQRIEVVTSFYKHPLEIVANGVLTSVILYVLVGLEPEAAAGAVLLTGLGELIYHWNVRTPYWLGFVFQRPESHLVHHQQGLHAFNYADLPVIDMVFGTFRNPRHWDAACGFTDDRELRLGEMLIGRDVHRAPVELGAPSDG